MANTTSKKTKTGESAKPPVFKLRDHALNVAGWERTTLDGKTFYNVTFERRYNKDGVWSSTQSLGEDDLLQMAELFRQAYQEIKNLRQPAREAE